ncbi:hypothetical protein ACQEUV_33095 [Micromonospora aurantiaca (nom. illeg.)]|uniref:hypothetical protein n=1 Tax=Micromonospora aurantiaca (nom. illeg.) TaxID=47850 RepID=UPI003DA495D8
MSADSVARVGRWSFSAGWILGIAAVTLARLLDWSDLVGAAVAIGVPLTAYRVIERISRRLVRRAQLAKMSDSGA